MDNNWSTETIWSESEDLIIQNEWVHTDILATNVRMVPICAGLSDLELSTRFQQDGPWGDWFCKTYCEFVHKGFSKVSRRSISKSSWCWRTHSFLEQLGIVSPSQGHPSRPYCAGICHGNGLKWHWHFDYLHQSPMYLPHCIQSLGLEICHWSWS